MEFGAFAFDDDLFDTKQKKNQQDISETIKNYAPKLVNSKVKLHYRLLYKKKWKKYIL